MCLGKFFQQWLLAGYANGAIVISVIKTLAQLFSLFAVATSDQDAIFPVLSLSTIKLPASAGAIR